VHYNVVTNVTECEQCVLFTTLVYSIWSRLSHHLELWTSKLSW